MSQVSSSKHCLLQLIMAVGVNMDDVVSEMFPAGKV